MRIFFLTICLSCLTLYAQAQIVTIPDSLFKNALIATGVDTNTDSIIQTSEAEAITRLSVNSKNISDLTGIEAFTNLTYLRCDTNNLISLNLTANTKIDSVFCQSNVL